MNKSLGQWSLVLVVVFASGIGIVFTFIKMRQLNTKETSIALETSTFVDQLAQESVIDGIQAEFPDIHFLFTDIVSRRVTKTATGYSMETTAKGTLEFVAYAHYEDLEEEGWVMEISPDANNLEIQEFDAYKDGMRMHFLGRQISPDQVSFSLEVSK